MFIVRIVRNTSARSVCECCSDTGQRSYHCALNYEITCLEIDIDICGHKTLR